MKYLIGLFWMVHFTSPACIGQSFLQKLDYSVELGWGRSYFSRNHEKQGQSPVRAFKFLGVAGYQVNESALNLEIGLGYSAYGEGQHNRSDQITVHSIIVPVRGVLRFSIFQRLNLMIGLEHDLDFPFSTNSPELEIYPANGGLNGLIGFTRSGLSLFISTTVLPTAPLLWDGGPGYHEYLYRWHVICGYTFRSQ